MPAATKPTKRRTKPQLVHQFLIVLSGIDPLIWRRVQVPERYSFWEPPCRHSGRDGVEGLSPSRVPAL